MSRVFCGREQEIEILRRAYRAIAHEDAHAPQVVTLVAESGLGKTRLVQELYRWLSTTEDHADPDGYWPDELGAVDDNLQLNPAADACSNTKPVPFLWWGLRLPDPGARNQAVAGQLAASLETLRPHLEPVHRTRRRRGARKDVGITIGKLALDLAIDVVPGGGLFKTLGETAAELGQHVRQLWNDAPMGSVQQLEAQQREDLASRIVSDLGLLLDRESAEGTAVPVVIVVDDGQFSEGDPSIVAFVDKMLAAAIANRWRVLMVVTYWAAEWNRHASARQADTIAGVLHTHAARLGAAWSHVALGPVDELAPMLMQALPGLHDDQQQALLDRAGGNPRYLDEILRFCTRNPRLFEGRRLEQALTAQGLGTVLERTVHLHELVEERLNALEPDVRHSLLLASVQGQEFLAPVVGEVSEILGVATDASALARAEHPHAFIHQQPGDLRAFAQRVFHQVAAASVANELDEDAVTEALRAVIRRRLDDTNGMETATPSTRVRTCLLATHALAASDAPGDGHRVAYALARLGTEFAGQHDYELSRRFLTQLVDALDHLDPATTSYYLYYLAAEHLREQGAYVEAQALLRMAIEAWHARAEGSPSATSPSDLALLFKSLGQTAQHAGDLETAEHAFREALGIDRQAVANGTSPFAERDLMVSLFNVAGLAQTRGDLPTAERDCLEACSLARVLHEREPSDQSREDIAFGLVALADIALAAGDSAQAQRLYDERLAMEAAGVDPHADPEEATRRALVRERLARLALEAGDVPAAEAWLVDALSLREPAARRLGTPDALNDLANLLRSKGDAAQRREDLVAADAAFRESLAISTSLVTDAPSPKILRGISLTLERFGKLALLVDDLDRATAIFEQRLELDRQLAESSGAPGDWRNLMASHYWLADIAEQRGAPDEAVRGFDEALVIARELAARTHTASARQDLRPILTRLVALARHRGDDSLADRYEEELDNA